MNTRPARLLVSAIGLCAGLALALPPAADAAPAHKHKKRVAAPAAVSAKVRHRTTAPYWGQNLVRPGPLYNGPDYLGDDPDPNIRFQLLRDLDSRYGGAD
jgi:hypothetical protein